MEQYKMAQYKCATCGRESQEQETCCGQPMQLVSEQVQSEQVQSGQTQETSQSPETQEQESVNQDSDSQNFESGSENLNQ